MDTVTALAFTIDAKDTTRKATPVCFAPRGPDRAGYRPDKDELEEIRLAGILHDIGKIGVPESVLNKPSA